MTVIKLKEELAKYPDDMQVFLADRKTEFTYGLLNTVYVKEIEFMEEPLGEPIASDEVLILDEE